MRTRSPVGRVLVSLALFTSLALAGCGERMAAPRADEKLVLGPVQAAPLPTGPTMERAALPVDVEAVRIWRSPLEGLATGSFVGPGKVTASTTLSVDAKLLVISADGSEPALKAIRKILDYLGTPYDVMIAATDPGGLTDSDLGTGTHGYYSGVILTNGGLGYHDPVTGWTEAFDAAEWNALLAYEELFGVRQITWYTFPTTAYGFAPLGSTTTITSGCSGIELPGCTLPPIHGTLTAAGASVFSHVNGATPVGIRFAWTYFAQPDLTTTPGTPRESAPLLVDANGNALILKHIYESGRENLAMTFDSNEDLLHGLRLGYDLISWVSQGLFLGERHVYLMAHMDDLFLENDLFQSTATYRMDDDDLEAVSDWQLLLQTDPLTPDFRVDWAFNGEGTIAYAPDPLTPKVAALQSEFKFINHTWSHANLDHATEKQVRSELRQNAELAKRTMKFLRYSDKNLVTPDVSGLQNPSAMKAAFSAGVRYVVSDTSYVSGQNPAPNVGLVNPYARILMIPRHPTNLFYDVSTPSEWVYAFNQRYFSQLGRVLDLDEILDHETGFMVRYMLNGDMDPLMFHQANTRAYDVMRARTLLADLIDHAVAEYAGLMNFPILSPTMDELGERMSRRMAYDSSGARATIGPGNFITITAQQPAVVPVTGLQSLQAESYGGVTISWIPVAAGQSVTFPLY